MLFSTPYWLRRLYGKDLIWEMPDDGRTIYLSFDDGPNPDTTPVILHTLKQYDANATFFCVGENVVKNPELYEMIHNNGHAVGNHTYNHLNGWKTSKARYLENVQKNREVVNNLIFRPPYGRITRSQKKSLSRHYDIFMWTVLSRDFDARVSRETCLEKTWEHTRPGAIVVFHDHPKAIEKVEYVLAQYIERAIGRGYRFKALSSKRDGLF
ncbi:MAG: polysaccharide deacetylase family protein [Bacteroidales bacterium]|nr:polysaccharide deacetylase family protein [Bacteroidales bacterium]